MIAANGSARLDASDRCRTWQGRPRAEAENPTARVTAGFERPAALPGSLRAWVVPSLDRQPRDDGILPRPHKALMVPALRLNKSETRKDGPPPYSGVPTVLLVQPRRVPPACTNRAPSRTAIRWMPSKTPNSTDGPPPPLAPAPRISKK